MRVFAKRVYSFDPITRPVISFGFEEARDALIRGSTPGDLIVLVGMVDDVTHPEDRGRLLGIAEFAPIPMDLGAIFLEPTEAGFSPGESLKHLLIVRAWRFSPKLKLLDVLNEQLTFEALAQAVRLGDRDSTAVMALPKIELQLPELPYLGHLRVMIDAVKAQRPTTGPIPFAWEGSIRREESHSAFTYLLRFGERNVWKVGHTQDLVSRIAEINQHVPDEELNERWVLVLKHEWKSSLQAYSMEQSVLLALRTYRTTGERVRCAGGTVLRAWENSLNTIGTRAT